MNNKQKGSGILEFFTLITILFPIAFYTVSVYEIRERRPNEIIKIKPVIQYIEKNPVSSIMDTPIVVNQYQTPQRFKSSQTIIRKMNRNAHIKPFIGNKNNNLGYKDACMTYPFSSKIFHVDVKYPIASYFSLPVGVSILSANFITDTGSTGFNSNLITGNKIISGNPPNKKEHIIIQPIGLDTPDAQILIFTTAGPLNIMLHVKNNKYDEPMYCVEWILPPPPVIKDEPLKTIMVDSNYEMNGNWLNWESCHWIPQVWNDGRQTFIKYNEIIKEHPVLFGVYQTSFLKRKKRTQINTRYDSKNSTQIIDGLPDELVLVMGTKELQIKRLQFKIEVGQDENKL